jgi:peptidoglycan hydrolase-like protein with peptidoglycan-binding domain
MKRVGRKAVTRTSVVVGAIIVVGGAAVAAAHGVGGGTGNSPAAPPPAPATAPVTRATLSQTQQVAGTLGYGTTVPVPAGAPGKITWLPELGSILHRGQAVYKTNNVAVPLFYGTLPLYRSLHTGCVGEDVREVETNLAKLGYTGMTVDNRYTSATAHAVRKWQKDLGLTQNGVFDPNSVVIASNVIRVAALTAHLGGRADGPVLSYTATVRMVDVALDVSLQTLAKPGMPATITLPTGKSVAGKVAKVGTVATAGDQSRPATIDVTVTIDDSASLGTLDQAPVTVTVVSASVQNVLTVPVAALTVLPDGRYGVQVITGSTSHYTPVELGMSGDGRVEISGAGITEGTLVGVPA